MKNNTPKSLQEGLDFDFVGLDNDKIGFIIDGLTFRINSVKVEESEEGEPLLQFDYDVVEGDVEDCDMEQYEENLGMVIEKLMREQYEQQE